MNRPIQIVGSESPVFDGYTAVVWVVNMSSNCADARLKRITPGVLYTFIIRQDAAGGFTFKWPDGCVNAPEVSTAPNRITTANFIGTTGGRLTSNLPATWS